MRKILCGVFVLNLIACGSANEPTTRNVPDQQQNQEESFRFGSKSSNVTAVARQEGTEPTMETAGSSTTGNTISEVGDVSDVQPDEFIEGAIPGVQVANETILHNQKMLRRQTNVHGIAIKDLQEQQTVLGDGLKKVGDELTSTDQDLDMQQKQINEHAQRILQLEYEVARLKENQSNDQVAINDLRNEITSKKFQLFSALKKINFERLHPWNWLGTYKDPTTFYINAGTLILGGFGASLYSSDARFLAGSLCTAGVSFVIQCFQEDAAKRE